MGPTPSQHPEVAAACLPILLPVASWPGACGELSLPPAGLTLIDASGHWGRRALLPGAWGEWGSLVARLLLLWVPAWPERGGGEACI